MAYLGRPASTTVSATASTESFTGNGATQFGLSRTVSNDSSLEVFVSNVQQQPTVTYSIAGNVITFTEAPANGEPIYVIFRDYPTAPVFTVPDGSISTIKIQSDAITTAKINDGSITTSKIADSNVTTSKIADDAITSLKIAPNVILRGTTTYLGASLEKANVIASNVTATVTIDNQNNGIVYYTGNSTSNADVTVDFINMDSVTTGNVASFVLMITNNADLQAYVGNVNINGQTGNVVKWLGGVPTSGDSDINVYSFSVVKTADSSYTTLASKNKFE